MVSSVSPTGDNRFRHGPAPAAGEGPTAIPAIAPVAPGALPARATPPSPSAELVPLLSLELQGERHRAPTPAVNQRKSVSTARKGLSDVVADSETALQGLRGATGLRYALHQGSSSGHSSEQGGGHQQDGRSPMQVAARNNRGFEAARGSASAGVSVHMALCAADLAERCAVHPQRSDRAVMLSFLQSAMRDLLPGFVRDLADRLEALAASETPLDSRGAIRPVREVCADFLDLVRPLYSTYTSGPYLLCDARDVLCAAQDLLNPELDRRRDADQRFLQVMTDTVRPLLPILVMSSMPRPQQSAAHGSLANFPVGAWDEVGA